jgi:hypothetical protein
VSWSSSRSKLPMSPKRSKTSNSSPMSNGVQAAQGASVGVKRRIPVKCHLQV